MTTSTESLNTVSLAVFNEEQSWWLRSVYTLGNHRLKVEIRRNAYDHQSYGRGYAFDPIHMKWNVVIDLPISELQSEEVSYTDRDKDAVAEILGMDEDTILFQLRSVVG